MGNRRVEVSVTEISKALDVIRTFDKTALLYQPTEQSLQRSSRKERLSLRGLFEETYLDQDFS